MMVMSTLLVLKNSRQYIFKQNKSPVISWTCKLDRTGHFKRKKKKIILNNSLSVPLAINPGLGHDQHPLKIQPNSRNTKENFFLPFHFHNYNYTKL